jgi:predicted RNase H-like HicB family nuclease
MSLLEWDADAGAWVACVPALNHLSTFGETQEEALAYAREAILGYLEAAEKEGIALPLPQLMAAPDLLEQKAAHDGRIEIEPAPREVRIVQKGYLRVAVPVEPGPPLTQEIVRTIQGRSRQGT